MMELKTDRLIIRKFTSDDWKDLHEYLSDSNVLKFEPYEPFSEEQCREEAISRSNGDSFYAVCLKDSNLKDSNLKDSNLKDNNKLIGNLYFQKQDGDFGTWEIGYVFNQAYQKKGYASESVKELINYLFREKQARRIIAMCDPLNEASWKLLERVGMRREAHHRKEIYFFCDSNENPIWKDTYIYAILKEEVFE